MRVLEKRHNSRSHKQEAINELIVHCAEKYGHVVRLKGGDPFVFARGYEEIEFALKHGIQDISVVQGVSSSLAVPTSAGIPLTARNFNKSFWVGTATLQNGELSDDIKLAAASSATVVILMGLHKIEKIVEVFKQEGKNKTPLAIISKGTTAEEKSILGTVETIENIIANKTIESPGIIVVGEVVKLHPEFVNSDLMSLTIPS